MSKNVSALALAVSLAWAGPALAQEKAEVIHWWTSGGESAAVKVFAEQYTKAGGTWVDTAIAGGANARTAAINRTVGGTPPAMMQFNTGKQFDELVENDLLTDVEAIASEQKWKEQDPRRRSSAADAQRQDVRGAGEHPRPELALLQHGRAQEGRREPSRRTGTRSSPRWTRSRRPA